MDPNKKWNQPDTNPPEPGPDSCEEKKDVVKKHGKPYKKDGTPCSYKGRTIGSKNKCKNGKIKKPKTRKEIMKKYRQKKKEK